MNAGNNQGQHGPIFLVGAARSGTTLLQYMLRSHPRLSAPTGESHFIVPLCREASTFGDLKDAENVARVLERMRDISREFMDEDLHGIQMDQATLAAAIAERCDGTMPGLIRTLFELNAEGEGKSRWIDKTPYYILHLPWLAETFPDARFVHIIRDGRDCALSMLRRARDLRIFNVYHAAQFWSQYVDAGQQAAPHLPEGSYHELRYEELLERPEEVLHELCKFLGEPFDQRLIDFQRSGDIGDRTPLLRKPLQRDNRQKWRRKMTPWQIRVFESEAADTLRRNGYPLVFPDRSRLPLPVRIPYRLHMQVAKYLLPRKRHH